MTSKLKEQHWYKTPFSVEIVFECLGSISQGNSSPLKTTAREATSLLACEQLVGGTTGNTSAVRRLPHCSPICVSIK